MIFSFEDLMIYYNLYFWKDDLRNCFLFFFRVIDDVNMFFMNDFYFLKLNFMIILLLFFCFCLEVEGLEKYSEIVICGK